MRPFQWRVGSDGLTRAERRIFAAAFATGVGSRRSVLTLESNALRWHLNEHGYAATWKTRRLVRAALKAEAEPIDVKAERAARQRRMEQALVARRTVRPPDARQD